MHRPKLLLLDEPTAGVDPQARREFWDQIHALAGSGVTVLVSTHYMEEAERCHSIGYISRGKMLVTGTVEEVVRQSGLTTFIVHATATAELMSELRHLDGVSQVAPFGAAIHIVGVDAMRVTASLRAFAAERGLPLEPGRTSLEDVFIQLMNSGDAAPKRVA